MRLQNQPHRDARSHGQVLWWSGAGAVEWDAEECGSAQTQGEYLSQPEELFSFIWVSVIELLSRCGSSLLDSS